MLDLNAAASSRRMGKRSNWGSKQLYLPHVRYAVHLRVKERQARVNYSAERVLEEFAAIGFVNIRNVVNEHGMLVKRLEDLEPADSAAISEIVHNRTKDGASMKVKLHDKVAALKELARFHSLGEQDGSTKVMVVLDV